MYKILIDSSDRYLKVIQLVKLEDPLVESNSILVDEVTGDFDIVPTISDLLKKNNLKVSDIAEFIPNLGPGSFTGLKSGITIANVFNWALGKKLPQEQFTPVYGSEPNIHNNKY